MRVGTALLLLFAAAPAFAQCAAIDTSAGELPPKGLVVTTTIEPAATLPGIFPSLRLHVVNTSLQRRAIPPYMFLRVSMSSGKPVLVSNGDECAGLHVGIAERHLDPGASADIEMPSLGLTYAAPWLMFNERFTAPGVYELKIVLTHRPYPEPVYLDRDEYAVAARPATLTIDEAAGDDALAWKLLMDATAPLQLHLPAILIPQLAESAAREILERVPASAYAPYVIEFLPFNEQAATAESLLRSQRDTKATEFLRLTIAAAHESIWRRELSEPPYDAEKAIAAAKRARTEIEQLQRDTKNALIRNRCTGLLDEQWSEDEIRATAAVNVMNAKQRTKTPSL